MTFTQAFPHNLQLETQRVLLRGLTLSDLAQFEPLSHSQDLWKYFTKDLSQQNELEQWVKAAVADRGAERRFAFTIIEKETGRVCGSSSLGSISFYDQRIEIGWSWLGESFLGSGINTHAKFLLLQYAFETLGMVRVEIKTDNLNARAKRALDKIGATAEGVLRSHMLMFNNRRRDSIYYSILSHEWPEIKQRVFSGVV
jgi:N-acetyltransferase